MITEKELLKTAKALILSDCVDSFFVTNQEIARYIKRSRKDFIRVFESSNSQLSLIGVINLACEQLAEEGKIYKLRKSIKKPINN